MKRWWMRWYGLPADSFEYHGPWWISGWTAGHEDDDVPIFVAAVSAEDEAAARKVIEASYDDGAAGVLEWSFSNERADDWEPFCERLHARRLDEVAVAGRTGNSASEGDRPMTTYDCPKCGGSMGGPRYSPGQGCACHPEALYYSCIRCGYSMRKPTHDKDVPDEPRGARGTEAGK